MIISKSTVILFFLLISIFPLKAQKITEAATPGTVAPNIIIKEKNKNFTIKINELETSNYTKTMLLFYTSSCGYCEILLQKLPVYFENIKAKGVKIISVSADLDENIFKNKAESFLWKDAYLDSEGINFQTYGITGTPTIFLIDNTGKILLKTSALEEILGYINSPD
jgi:thioredoxin-related protein